MNPQRVYRFFPGLVALLTFVTFLPALQNDFLNWDDPTNFLTNLDYRGLGWSQLKWMWTSHLTGHYIPVAWMTLGLDYLLWGMNPFGYHLTSVLWHTANAVLFYFVALAILRIAFTGNSVGTRSGIPIGALFATLVFAVHPLRVESVAWATERRDVVSGCFYLLAILVYLGGFADSEHSIGRRRHWACFAFFALAILSKEIAVTLPVVLLILDAYPLRRLGGVPGRWIGPAVHGVWLEKIPFLALGMADAALALSIARQKNSYAALAGAGWFDRIAASIYSLTFYLRKTLAPVHLAPFHPLTPDKIDPWAAPLAASALVVLSVTVTAVLLRRKFPALLTVWLAYAVTLFPVLGIFDNGPQITADRYSYLACFGWALLGGAAVVAWSRRWDVAQASRALIPATAGLVLLSLAVATWQQARIWRDSDTLWTHALQVEPSFLAYVNMGQLLMERGDYLWAAEHFRQAIAMRPDFPPAHLGLAGALLSLHQAPEAAGEYRVALGLGQAREFAENGLACALALEGKLDEAVDHFHEALRIQPNYEDARRNLQQVLARKK